MGEEEKLDFEIGALEEIGILEVSAIQLLGRRCISSTLNTEPQKEPPQPEASLPEV